MPRGRYDDIGGEVSMRRIVSPALLLGAVLILAAVGAAGASANAAAPSKSATLHLVEKQVGFNYIDNPPHQGTNAPPLIGDQFAFTSDLLTRTGSHAGEIDATCMVTRGGVNAVAVCYGVFSLKGGQLTGIATTHLAANGPDRIAIVGGTGVYEGVTGSILSAPRGPNSNLSDDTFHVIWP
jgi:hypothetical protein